MLLVVAISRRTILSGYISHYSRCRTSKINLFVDNHLTVKTRANLVVIKLMSVFVFQNIIAQKRRDSIAKCSLHAGDNALYSCMKNLTFTLHLLCYFEDAVQLLKRYKCLGENFNNTLCFWTLTRSIKQPSNAENKNFVLLKQKLRMRVRLRRTHIIQNRPQQLLHCFFKFPHIEI
uniref:Uncharacterized protein n=1 Tax=Romanomermis culicivorax TaxID=13658 RepID=A0A915I2T8_ROMCU